MPHRLPQRNPRAQALPQTPTTHNRTGKPGNLSFTANTDESANLFLTRRTQQVIEKKRKFMQNEPEKTRENPTKTQGNPTKPEMLTTTGLLTELIQLENKINLPNRRHPDHNGFGVPSIT
jgi:hypothetical protein